MTDFKIGDRVVTIYESKIEPFVPKIVAALPHDTSRTYAKNAASRVLPPWANKVLKAAASGEEVDVVEFRKAATMALSLASTRAGRSMGRREWAKQARHLTYWADALIDQHLQGLPVYEPGARSPKIRELEKALTQATAELDKQTETVRNLRNERGSLTEAASEERRRLCAEIDNLKVIVQQNDVTLDGLYQECNELHAALEYAFTLLLASDQSRLAGFRDGYAQHVNDAAK